MEVQPVAERDGLRGIFFGWPDIGGRSSVLSDFGLVPAAIMGVDVAKLLDRTEAMVYACMPSVPVEENPGVVLGAIIIFGVGQVDDLREVSPPAKIAGTVLAGSVLSIAGVSLPGA